MKTIACIITFCLLQISLFCQSDYKVKIETYRTEHKAGLAGYENAPLNEEDIDRLEFFDISPKYKFDAVYIPAPQEAFVVMPTYSGQQKEYKVYGTVKFVYKGEEHELTVFQSTKHRNHPIYKDYLFLPFKDLSNGDGSYGGGRYMDIKLDEIKGNTLELDFNKAYNPWCAYSDNFHCPIPPRKNHLAIAIKAGEKDFVRADDN